MIDFLMGVYREDTMVSDIARETQGERVKPEGEYVENESQRAVMTALLATREEPARPQQSLLSRILSLLTM